MKKLFIFALLFSLFGCFACTLSAANEKDTPAPEGETPAMDTETLFNTAMSADDALAAAKRARVVVMESVCVTSGREVWNEFYTKTEKGEPASVLIAQYYTLDPERVDPELYEKEKDDYPVLYFSLLTYNGESYAITVKDCRTCKADSSGEWKYLKHFTGSLRYTSSAYDEYDRYELLNDPDVTSWEQLEHGILSSQFGDYIPFHTVYVDYYNK